ncbi:transposase [Intrasporangium oryzae]|nr:transposase [Intrasporangium oryzae]
MVTDARWKLIEPLMPSSDGKRGDRSRDHRTIVEIIGSQFRPGIA